MHNWEKQAASATAIAGAARPWIRRGRRAIGKWPRSTRRVPLCGWSRRFRETVVTRNAERSKPFRSVSELIQLVERFESGTLPREEWNHRAYLAVAVWYFAHLEECEATERMICGIRRYNRAQRIRATPTGGYHETITLFWLAVARAFLAARPGQGVLQQVNGFLRTYWRRRNLFLEYYSRERIMSWSARTGWVEPDLKPLDIDIATPSPDAG